MVYGPLRFSAGTVTVAVTLSGFHFKEILVSEGIT